ncbi:hypothetical protein HWV62_21000 [Athelia sp. TMB]|nr:hypothetical protein HWV62_21000 [Athelia sp. TMB]
MPWVGQLDQGGYHGYNEDGALYPLHPKTVVSLVGGGKLVPPTTGALSDRSKGDVLSKGIAILQTIWFVIQCIARLAEHLPITNLEVMTLAYTVMTVAMYIAWWDKPQNVSCAIRVPVDSDRQTAEVDDGDFIYLRAIGHYVLGSQDDEVVLRSLRRVPTFWAGVPDPDVVLKADIIALPVAMAFGAVHCLAWSYPFTSHAELLLWRTSAIVIISVPAGVLIMCCLIMKADVSPKGVKIAGGFIGLISILIGAPLYICARIIFFIFAFTTLASLPHAIYQTVQWTDFIPHI